MRGGAAELHAGLFDLRHTVESAQPVTFFGDYDHGVRNITYAAGSHAISISRHGNDADCTLRIGSGDLALARRDVARRFRLSDDMPRIYNAINHDGVLTEPIRRYRGMRLTLNDPWETTVCFIVSQFNNVPRIRGIVRRIVERYGTAIEGQGGAVVARSFPTSEDLAEVTVKEFMECGAGFRARYLKEAAAYCSENLDLGRLSPRKYEKLKEALMGITGVGSKVADCIALMGYGSMEAFPVDVWVKRTVERLYFNGREKSISEIHSFARERFGRHAGYAQQYIFWSGRQMDREFRAVV